MLACPCCFSPLISSFTRGFDSRGGRQRVTSRASIGTRLQQHSHLADSFGYMLKLTSQLSVIWVVCWRACNNSAVWNWQVAALPVSKGYLLPPEQSASSMLCDITSTELGKDAHWALMSQQPVSINCNTTIKVMLQNHSFMTGRVFAACRAWRRGHIPSEQTWGIPVPTSIHIGRMCMTANSLSICSRFFAAWKDL